MNEDNTQVLDCFEKGIKHLCRMYNVVLFDTNVIQKPGRNGSQNLGDLTHNTINTEGIRKWLDKIIKFRQIIEACPNFTTVLPVREEVRNGATLFKNARNHYRKEKQRVEDYACAMGTLGSLVSEYSLLINKLDERALEIPQHPASNDIAGLLEKILKATNPASGHTPPSKTDYAVVAEVFALQMSGKKTTVISNDSDLQLITQTGINAILYGGLVGEKSIFRKIKQYHPSIYHLTCTGLINPNEICISPLVASVCLTGNQNQMRQDIARIEKAYAQHHTHAATA